jgi:hypothetical protein
MDRRVSAKAWRSRFRLEGSISTHPRKYGEDQPAFFPVAMNPMVLIAMYCHRFLTTKNLIVL